MFSAPVLRTYYKLTKPGIIYGNLVAAIAGFLLASRGHFNPTLFVSMCLGLYLIIASGCVANNIIDRKIDAKMERTKKRALVTGKISANNASFFATILGISGVLVLFFLTNLLTLLVALTGLFFYVVVYGIAKRGTVYSTIIGSVSGAVPPVVGYAAVTNRLDMEAFLLFLILVVWQMPHFYSIAIFRRREYEAANLPVLPVKVGVYEAKVHMLLYIAAFIIAASLFFALGYTGYVYLAVTVALASLWFKQAVEGFTAKENEVWARKMFKFSLLVLLTFCIMISLNSFLTL